MLLPYANLQIKHWNPGATAPLILPVHVICNTSDEDLHRNISINSRRPGAWVKQEPAHDRVAILCGSGPSLADSLEEIKAHAAEGAVVYAMNGAANYLHDNGLTADVQVMIDPRPITATLVGPARAHMFASQCHQDTFAAAPDAILWHLQIEGIDDDLPKYDAPFTLLGGAASVGNTATCLAFALGHRTMHIYGYDSSHRGAAGHAFHQSINDGDPLAKVLFNGREYVTSLTMKLQAERFQQTARLLEQEGCQIHVHGSGLLPDMWNTPPECLTERDKYQRMWDVPAYRSFSPGEESAQTFLDVVKPTGGTVIDFGCGTGRGGVALSRSGLDVVMVDFASNCRDGEAMHLPFVELDLTEPMGLRAPFGYCTDVMEHIPPNNVPAVVANIMASADTVFFQIATVPDNLGAAINQTLHLTVMPMNTWADLFTGMGYRVTWCKDLNIAAQFVVTRKKENA